MEQMMEMQPKGVYKLWKKIETFSGYNGDRTSLLMSPRGRGNLSRDLGKITFGNRALSLHPYHFIVDA